MTNDGLNTMVGACPERSRRDAENHVVSVSNSNGTGTYTYDGNGQRIKKIGGGNTIVSIFAGAQALAEYYNGAAPSSPTNEYIYAGSLKIASIQSGTTDYWHNDHLSPRVRTSTSGSVADQRGTFPFGETWYSPSGSTYMFTTYYRDVEAEGNDYAQARTYVGGLGRFSSPDPIPGNSSDPQSLNRYSYVRNMPHLLSDPFGTCPGGVAQNRDDTKSDESKQGGPSDSDSEMGEPQEGISSRWPYGGCAGFTADGGGNAGTFSVDGGETFDPSNVFGITGIGTFGGAVGGGFTQTWVPDGTVSSDAGTTDYPGYWDFVSIYGDDGSNAAPNVDLTTQKTRDLIKAALATKNLSSCLHNFFGPGQILTNANLPRIDSSQSLSGASAGQTDPATVPDVGRATIQIDKGIFASLQPTDPYLVGTYPHETANVLATQRFTQYTKATRAYAGPLGGPPTQAQLNSWDHDIGNLFEQCIFPGK